MISRWTALRRAVTAWREGRIGDVAAYKAIIAGGQAHAPIAAQLANLREPLPQIELDELGQCVPGSFGRAYADHMAACGLTPLTFGAEARTDVAGAAIMPLRYALLHDAYHVLLGEATDWPGECAVWSFVSAQRYGPAFDRNGKISLVAYSLLHPMQRHVIHAAYERGKQRGEKAVCLITQKIEDYWNWPLDELRRAWRLQER